MTSNCGNKRRQRRGFSLLEMAIVLGIIGVVLASLWGVISIVHETIKRDEATRQIEMAVQNVRAFYLGKGTVATPAGSGTFSNLTDYLLRQGVLPQDMIRDRAATTLRADNSWGSGGPSGSIGDGTFAVDNTDVATSYDRFRIELRGLSFSACVALLSRLSGESGPKGLLYVEVNGTTEDEMPVSAEEAADLCEKSPSGTENKVGFIYRLRVQR